MSEPTPAKLHKDVASIKKAMRDGGWMTLEEIQNREWWNRPADKMRNDTPIQTVSARVRDLRKEKFGAHRVERRHAGNRVWEYKLFRKVKIKDSE